MTQYFDKMTETYKEIPRANWYVLSNDKFMSGWGLARNKINTCVVPCESEEQAQRVYDYVESRRDQKYIRITDTPPRSKPNVIYSLCLGWLKCKAKYN